MNSLDIPVTDCSFPYDVRVTATNSLGQQMTMNASIIVQSVLSVNISVHAQIWYDETQCWGDVTVTYQADEYTDGTHPIVDVAMSYWFENEPNTTIQVPLTEPLPTSSFTQIETFESECGASYIFEITVTNERGDILTKTQDFTVPLPPD